MSLYAIISELFLISSNDIYRVSAQILVSASQYGEISLNSWLGTEVTLHFFRIGIVLKRLNWRIKDALDSEIQKS